MKSGYLYVKSPCENKFDVWGKIMDVGPLCTLLKEQIGLSIKIISDEHDGFGDEYTLNFKDKDIKFKIGDAEIVRERGLVIGMIKYKAGEREIMTLKILTAKPLSE